MNALCALKKPAVAGFARIVFAGRYNTTRLYATPPQFKSKGSLLVNSINYVREVDSYQESLSKSSSEKDLAAQLMERIAQEPELLCLLLLFHRELAQLGITPDSKAYTPRQVWNYRVAYVLKLARMSDVFWAQCHQQEISQRSHRLGFLPTSIGVLHPLNFEGQDYRQLQSGNYNGIDLTHIEILGKKME